MQPADGDEEHERQDSESESSPLLQLPLGVLEQLWNKLGEISGLATNRDAQALRCSCKALAAATSPFIHSLPIEISLSHQGPQPLAVLRESQRQLACFPKAATLSRLRWSCWDDHVPFVVLPCVLPALFGKASARLASLQAVELMGIAAFTTTDFSAIVSTCPALRSVTLEDVCVLGPALQPLAGPQGQALRVLHMSDMKFSHSPEEFGASLAGLTQLTALTAEESLCYEESSGRDTWGLVHTCMHDLLPHLCGLTGLRALTLVQSGFCCMAACGARAMFDQLTHLDQLTSLRLAQAPFLGFDRCVDCFTLEAGHVHALAALPRLACLSLPDAEVGPEALRELARRLPHLTELEVGTPKTEGGDLSGLRTGWKVLKVAGGLTPSALTELPLGGVRLVVRWHGLLSWRLDPKADREQLAETMRRAAQVLVDTWAGNEAGQRHLRLALDMAPDPPFSDLLATLEPLKGLPDPDRFTLFLCPEWNVSQADVELLARHLPHIRSVGVHTQRPAFPSFVDALGRRGVLPQLRHLHISDDAPLEEAARQLLVTLAVTRASQGLPLAIHCRGCLSDEECGELTQLVCDHAGHDRPDRCEFEANSHNSHNSHNSRKRGAPLVSFVA